MTDHETEETMEGRHWTRTEKKQWMIGLFCGCATLYACRTVMPLCAVPIAKELGWDKTESGSVLSAFFWGYTMTQFLGGYLSDRVGGDVVLPIAACCWSLVTFWTPQLAYISDDKFLTLRIIIFSRVLLGVFQGFHYPGFSSLISRKIPEQERSLTYSVVCSGSHLGTLLCGSLGSIIMETYGWQTVFYFLGISGLAWMLCMRYILINRHRLKYIPMTVIEKRDIPPVSTKDSSSTPWVTLFFKLSFWSMLVGHFCENNAFFILLSWLPTYFHENFPDAKGWVFNVIPWVVTIPSSIFGGWLADFMITKGYSVTFVRKFMNTITMLGTAFFLVVISYTSSYLGALVCMALAVCCCGFHNSGILVNPQDIAPKHAGSVFGIMNMAGAIPGFIGVYMAGHILEVTKSWSAVFNQTAAVSVFGWVVYTLFGTGKQVI
ncbi:voltage-gated purine nucleotide uniporter SLC17A9-like isoform X1 [Ruditapes philippinarum]|uniref:voltage-gated purine nucleotide uniporter SLC17A9-like isoform X1 n=1 Tax=Ruditapes philippinarum TaxID=129788 RepID=UPI00295ACB56|nr:voltage-gated purine nucleotide uniporter SLC17A9-like isoform X1 [Ruditapes philippinarum]